MKKIFKVQLVRKESATYEVVADCSIDAELQAKELYKREAGYSGIQEFTVESVKLIEVAPDVPPSQEVLSEQHKRQRRRKK